MPALQVSITLICFCVHSLIRAPLGMKIKLHPKYESRCCSWVENFLHWVFHGHILVSLLVVMWKSLWPKQTKVESRLVHRAPPASQSFYWSAVSSDWLRRFEPSITQKQPPVKHNIRLKLCEVWQRLQTNISPFDLFISFYSDKWRSNLREAACCKSDWLTSVSRH